MKKTTIELLASYSALGYDVCLTVIFGKDAVKMVKRYSHKAEKPLYCTQIQEHERLKDFNRFHDILNFMYNDIQEQEKTGNYKEEITD